MCNGIALNISEYETLYSLIGTTYGGDGVQTFNLPNFQSRVVAGSGQGPGLSPYPQGTMLGAEKVTLTTSQMPLHQHAVPPMAPAAATGGTPSNAPKNNYPGLSTAAMYAAAPTAGKQLGPMQTKMQPVGGNQAHTNVQPVLALNFIIATEGIYPSQP
jgi:microcystin-dependent protein